MLTRITITGAECTGKTTLVRALADHYGVPWIPEAARTFVASAGRPVRRSDISRIAALHVSLLLHAPESGIVLCDTDLLSTVAYARHYFGSCPVDVTRQASALAADLYILAADDLPWEPETNQRGSVEDRSKVQVRVRKLVEKSGRPWVQIDGTGSDRFDAARQAVDRFLDSLPPRVQPGFAPPRNRRSRAPGS